MSYSIEEFSLGSGKYAFFIKQKIAFHNLILVKSKVEELFYNEYVKDIRFNDDNSVCYIWLNTITKDIIEELKNKIYNCVSMSIDISIKPINISIKL